MVGKIVIEKSEFLLLLLAIGVLIFIAGNAPRFRQIQCSKILIASFIMFFSGWVFTVVEGFFWKTTLNFMEHISYLAGSVFLAAWCWKIPLKKFSQANLNGTEIKEIKNYTAWR